MPKSLMKTFVTLIHELWRKNNYMIKWLVAHFESNSNGLGYVDVREDFERILEWIMIIGFAEFIRREGDWTT